MDHTGESWRMSDAAPDARAQIGVDLPSTEEFVKQRQRMTLPERLCFLVDTSAEMGSAWEGGGPRLQAVREAIRLIVRRKVNLSVKHQYAVATFDQAGGVRCICAFSNRVSDVDAALEALEVSADTQGQGAEGGAAVDLAAMVDALEAGVFGGGFPAPDASGAYVGRCILIYGRSSEVPLYPREPALLSSPLFYLDVLYMHHRSSEPGVLCQEIFDVLCEAQSEGSGPRAKTAYVVESHPSSLKFLPAVAVMLAHPVQRSDLYGESGMLERLDPSETAIAEVRARLLEAAKRAAATPDNRAKAGGSASSSKKKNNSESGNKNKSSGNNNDNSGGSALDSHSGSNSISKTIKNSWLSSFSSGKK